MVLVCVYFRLASKRWRREFSADDGTSVQQLKELILKSTGSAEDLSAFELRRIGKRIPDNHLLWEDCVVDFKFLGADRGSRRAARDAAHAAAAKAVGAKSAAMGLEHVLLLQADLREGFGSPAFQRRLDELEEKHKGGNERMFQAERQKLFLSVQKLVLPKWGFAGNAKGVFEMMGAMMQERFNVSPEFQRNGWYLNKLLRLGPVGPMPEVPAAAAAPETRSAESEALLRAGRELAARLEAEDFRGPVDSLARRLGGGEGEPFRTAREALAHAVHAAVLPKHGREPSAVGISEFWSDLLKGDEEMQMLAKRLLELASYAGRGPSAEGPDERRGSASCPCAGSWSCLSPPHLVYTTVQYGSVVFVVCPEEHWSPARGTINDKQVILLDSPDLLKGYFGQLDGDAICWQTGDTWHRHVETSVTVRWETGDGGRETSLQAPPGATLAWVREALLRQDASLQGLRLAAADGPGEPLPDAAVVTPLLGRLRALLPRPPRAEAEEAPAEGQPGTQEAQEAPAKEDRRLPAQAQGAESKRKDEKPGTPRTEGQLFDFHDLPDEV